MIDKNTHKKGFCMGKTLFSLNVVSKLKFQNLSFICSFDMIMIQKETDAGIVILREQEEDWGDRDSLYLKWCLKMF